MPPDRFALIPFCANTKESPTAEFSDTPHGLPDLVLIHPEYIDIRSPGTFFVCYKANCKSSDACPALFLNRREIPATRDFGKSTCGSAVIFLSDTVKSAALSLCILNDIPEPVKGFVLISVI